MLNFHLTVPFHANVSIAEKARTFPSVVLMQCAGLSWMLVSRRRKQLNLSYLSNASVLFFILHLRAQSHRTVGVVRDLWGSLSPTPRWAKKTPPKKQNKTKKTKPKNPIKPTEQTKNTENFLYNTGEKADQPLFLTPKQMGYPILWTVKLKLERPLCYWTWPMHFLME